MDSCGSEHRPLVGYLLLSNKRFD